MTARSNTNARALLLVVFLGAGGCQGTAPPRPQALVHIDTDAPAPRMVNRLRLTLLDAELRPVCESCARLFGIDETTTWPISFGAAAAEDGSARYLRATLFPAGRTTAGEPDPPTALDRIVRIGPRDGEGIDEQRVLLPLDCAGFPPDLAARTSCPSSGGGGPPVAIEDATPWDGSPTRIGTWHADYVRPCAGEPRPDSGRFDGEACIPGGVFWMGDYRSRGMGLLDGTPEHAVALSPFFLDRHEYTVARYRAAVADGFKSSVPAPLTSDKKDPPWCSLPPDAGDASHDRLPLNCVLVELARELCDWEGGRLATEAEWEWAAGGEEREWLFPWGDTAKWPSDLPDKRSVEVGTHPADRTPDGIFDMSINVAEMTDDAFDPYTGPCWKPGSYGPDPRCDAGLVDDPRLRATRGGYYGGGSPGFATAVSRLAILGYAPQLGFRCARNDK